METKSLLIGIASFIAGGLLVSVAATTFDKNDAALTPNNGGSMTHLVDSLRNKTGNDFDKQFIASMIEHHEGAVAMAKQAATQAKHQEIKGLAQDIISAQEKEIAQMKLWQKQWGYGVTPADGSDRMQRMGH